MKLSMPEYQVGREKAEDYVWSLCKDLKIQIKCKSELKGTVYAGSNDNRTSISLPEEINFVRCNGKANALQAIFDAKDRFFNTPLSMGYIADIKNIGIKMSSNYGAHTSTLMSSGYIESPEISLSEDIVYYRKEAVKFFNNAELSSFYRAYRAYLQSCISLVECFIHRHAFHIKSMIPSMSEYQNTAILDSRASIDERLEALMTTFATHRITDFKNSRHRSKFIELKGQRNDIVHPASPSISYEVKSIVKYLNYAGEGIGGFMAEMRKYMESSENIGFIRQIKTLPEIRVVNGA